MDRAPEWSGVSNTKEGTAQTLGREGSGDSGHGCSAALVGGSLSDTLLKGLAGFGGCLWCASSVADQ